MIKTDPCSLTNNDVHLRTKVTDIEHFSSGKSLIFNPNNLSFYHLCTQVLYLPVH